RTSPCRARTPTVTARGPGAFGGTVVGMQFTSPDEPDRDAWIAGLREQIARDMPVIDDRPPFTVLRLAAPALTPAVLGGWQEENGRLTEVELTFGDPLSAAGPFAVVRSQAAGHEPQEPADLVADERVRLEDM